MTDSTLNRFLAAGDNAARAAFTPDPPTPASGPDPTYLWWDTDDQALYAYDFGLADWVAVGGGGAGTVTSVAAGAGLAASPSPITGSGTISSILPITPQGRLTLTSGAPVMTSDVTGATTIYYSPYNGNYVPIYDGTNFVPTTFTELSQATTDNTKSPAAVANNSNYDLFVWNDSGTKRCTRGPAWSSDTSRGTGAGTTELERVNGILVNKISITNGPAAQRGTYVGSIRSNGSASVDMIFVGTGAAGGSSTTIGVWNAYNRRRRVALNFDDTNSWTYTTDTWRIKNNNNNNKIQFVIGLQEDDITATANVSVANSSANVHRFTSIALDSTSAITAGGSNATVSGIAANNTLTSIAGYTGIAPLGFHYLAPLERSAATGTSTWFGDNGADGVMQSLFRAEIFC